MRIALVSPYSWTYPGGVTRHIQSLTGELLGRGHDVRVLAPADEPGFLARRLHVGHDAAPGGLPDYVTPLGRTVGVPSNDAVSNLAMGPGTMVRLRHELAVGGFDVVHLHEPVAPLVGWDALMASRAPMVGTFHCYSERATPHRAGNVAGASRRLNRLAVRIAVSEAAAWTGQRFYGGRYRIVPNGVDVPGDPATLLGLRPEHHGLATPERPLRLAFVGQAVERKGLPVLLAAFEALREQLPVELTVVGADAAAVHPLLHDARGVRALGKVDDATKVAELRRADVLVAPSLRGESFGMVLTEAFACGTPVVCSDIAGYRDVVRDGEDGVLVPPGDATALAEALRLLALEPERRRRLGAAAARSAQRFSWSHVADEVLEAYDDALAVPAPSGVRERVARRHGLVQGDGGPAAPAVRLASLEPVDRSERPARRRAAVRRGLIGLAGVGAVVGSVVGVERIGVRAILDALVASSPLWVLLALALMCASMAVRAVAWRAILRAALPGQRVRLPDTLRATSIGVLMSATLPARLGEPARAMVMAGHVGPPRRALGAVLGSIVSQTVLNIVALVVLGVTMFLTSSYFDGHQGALVLFAAAPVAILLAVVALPALLRGSASSWSVVARVRGALDQVRSGLGVFRSPRFGAEAAFAQLGAWAIQWLSCYVLLVAFGLEERAGLGAAAAVLFAVNVTAVLPVTPSNLGVFQAACVAVLGGAYGVGYADALGYGIILQAVEMATALVMGAPALVKEGMSWRDMRLRTMTVAPVELQPLPDEVARGVARTTSS